jgi:hypothetical protein
LGAGIVNACVLEPEPSQGSVSLVHVGHDQAKAHDSHDGHDHGGHKHQSPHDAKSPCVKFCDEASVGAQPVKQQVDPFSAVWLGPIPSGSMDVKYTPTLVGPIAIDSIRWRPAIPIAIAFLRLTL